MKNTSHGFKLPDVDVIPAGDGALYGNNMDPLADAGALERMGNLPHVESASVKNSPVGVGYETLDRDTFDPRNTYELMAKSGVKWARAQTGWMKCEKTKGNYDFAWLDETVDGLLRIGIQPWLSVSFGNPLYMRIPEYETYAEDHPGEEIPHVVRGYVGEVPLYYGEEAVLGWRKYVLALAEHFHGRVDHWEIWNEPNTFPNGFWRTRGRYDGCSDEELIANCAADYVELVKITAEQIHQAIPDARIIGGAISNGKDAMVYIRQLAKNGISNHIDAFSYHPYGVSPEFEIETRHNYIRDSFKRSGRKIQIWQGEAGRDTGYGSSNKGKLLSEYNQAKYLVRRHVTDVRLGSEVSSYFMVSDKASYSAGKVSGMGVIDIAGKPKLSFFTLQAMGFLFSGVERADDLYVRVFQHGRPLTSLLRHQAMVTAKFRRQGVPMFCYYLPEIPDLDVEPGRLDLSIYVDGEKDVFDELILVDPIRRQVYRIKKILRSGGYITIQGLPYTDYPLFITDASALGKARERTVPENDIT